MWPTLLVIIVTSITISHCHDGSQDQNIVTTITHQDINTSRVRRFLSGTRYTNYPGKPGYAQNGATSFNRNQNTTQHYVNPVQNYNYSTPGYYPNNGNTNNIKPLYPTPQGYPPYPNNNYSGYPAPYPQPSNIKPLYPTPQGYPQYPSNSSGNPATYPQPNNINPVYPTPSRYPQYPSNSSGYPIPYPPPNNKPYNPTQFPGNYSGYPAPYPQPSNIKPVYPTPQGYPQYPSNSSGYPIPYPPPNINIPTTIAPWVRPAQNNSSAYPAYNSTQPGYNNAVKYNMCRSNSTTGATGMDACVIVGGGNCSEGQIRIGDLCVPDDDDE